MMIIMIIIIIIDIKSHEAGQCPTNSLQIESSMIIISISAMIIIISMVII